MSYQINIDPDTADNIVRDILKMHVAYLQDDLNKVRELNRGHIFSTDKYEDIQEIQSHISAFTKVLSYFGDKV